MKRIAIASFISVFSLTSILAFSADNIEKVSKNMTTNEVRDILGKPSEVIDQGAAQVWKYGADTEVSFVNGKVRSIASPRF